MCPYSLHQLSSFMRRRTCSCCPVPFFVAVYFILVKTQRLLNEYRAWSRHTLRVRDFTAKMPRLVLPNHHSNRPWAGQSDVFVLDCLRVRVGTVCQRIRVDKDEIFQAERYALFSGNTGVWCTIRDWGVFQPFFFHKGTRDGDGNKSRPPPTTLASRMYGSFCCCCC